MGKSNYSGIRVAPLLGPGDKSKHAPPSLEYYVETYGISYDEARLITRQIYGAHAPK